MPGYGILNADSGTGLLPWSWAEERLLNARNYWVATTRPDGRPHCMPVWGIWLDGTFYFSTGPRSQKARNLARSPRCVVCPERADEAVILEGVAEEITDPSLLKRFREVYEAKYQWDMDTSAGGIYVVRPLVAFAFRETNDFLGSATRWHFPSD
jgi:PPOX class probable F420-dependent enzyme